jgi:hypothetical protein
MNDRKVGTLKGTMLISGVNERLEPFIQIRVTAEVNGREITLLGQASPAELRTMGLNHFAVAEAAESDSLIARYFTKDLKLGSEEAAVVVGRLRTHRSEALADLGIATMEVEDDG